MVTFNEAFINIVSSPLWWALFIVLALIAIIFILRQRRSRRLKKYNIGLFLDLGNGKTSLKIMKAGWFGKYLYARGLWWSGPEVFRAENNIEILNVSDEDFQVEIAGKKGVYVYKDPTKPNVYVPINELEITGKKMVGKIPPADFIDTAVYNYRQLKKEIGDWKDKLLPFAFLGIVVLVIMVLMIVNIQYIHTSQQETLSKQQEILSGASSQASTQCKEICSIAIQTALGSGGSKAP